MSFKPYYNWNTFNTMVATIAAIMLVAVLNLIITGIPSIQGMSFMELISLFRVLNLIITGIPSILYDYSF